MNATALQLDLFSGEPRRGEAMRVCAEIVAERGLNARSLATHKRRSGEWRGRKALILDCIRIKNRPMTDREIKCAIFGDGDMNLVRPRINEMIRDHQLMVTDTVQDDVTGEDVRRVWLA